jgi:hypothetical protein
LALTPNRWSPPAVLASDETDARNLAFSLSALPGSSSLYSMVLLSRTPLSRSAWRSSRPTSWMGLGIMAPINFISGPRTQGFAA